MNNFKKVEIKNVDRQDWKHMELGNDYEIDVGAGIKYDVSINNDISRGAKVEYDVGATTQYKGELYGGTKNHGTGNDYGTVASYDAGGGFSAGGWNDGGGIGGWNDGGLDYAAENKNFEGAVGEACMIQDHE